MVWALGANDNILIKCAHCSTISRVLDLSATYDEALLRRQVASSQSGHARVCPQRRRKW